MDGTRWFVLYLIPLPIIDGPVNRQLLAIVYIGKAFYIEQIGLGPEVIHTGSNYIEIGISNKGPDMRCFVVSDEDL
jgi:formate hydrogenlyase subunit 4